MKRIQVTSEMQAAMDHLMQKKGWNLTEIAGYLNVSASTVQRILNGEVSRCGENIARRLEEMGEYTGVYCDRARGGGETSESAVKSQRLEIPAAGGVTINITTQTLNLYVTGEEDKPEAGTD